MIRTSKPSSPRTAEECDFFSLTEPLQINQLIKNHVKENAKRKNYGLKNGKNMKINE